MLRALIESVVVERTEPGEPIKLRVNGKLAVLVEQPLFAESSLSGVILWRSERPAIVMFPSIHAGLSTGGPPISFPKRAKTPEKPQEIF